MMALDSFSDNPLTPDELGRLQKALEYVFERESLQRFLSFALNVNLSAISSQSNSLSSLVLDVIRWAQHNAQLGDFLEKACDFFPNSPELQDAVEPLLASRDPFRQQTATLATEATEVTQSTNAWSEDEFAARLQRFHTASNLATGESEATASQYDGYHKAAAVLAFFDDPERLRPCGASPNQAERSRALAALRTDTTIIRDREGTPRLLLDPAVRSRILREFDGDRRAIRIALRVNYLPGDRKKDRANATERYGAELGTLFALFVDAIEGRLPPVDALEPEELAAALQVTHWLRDTGLTGLPDEGDLKAALEFREFLRPMTRLADDHYFGRERELEQMRRHADVILTARDVPLFRHFVRRIIGMRERPPLLIYGPGGIGKSALISRFLFRHVRAREKTTYPFIYLDFDRPGLLADQPPTLLLEIVRQVGLQYPQIRVACEGLRQRWQQRIGSVAQENEDSTETYPSGSSLEVSRNWRPLLPAEERREFEDDFAALIFQAGLQRGPFLLVLDTFEEVQYRSRDFVQELWTFLEELQSRLPGLRIVLSGRVPAELPSGAKPVDTIALTELSTRDAQMVLRSFSFRDDVSRRLAAIIGGFPLDLRLTAAYLCRFAEGEKQLSELTVDMLNLDELKHSNAAEYIFHRILDHIGDVRARKLAYPGLVLRRITPDLIRHVLAGPCGVSIEDDADAHVLFTVLAKEISLVAAEEGGSSLRHRPDVRRRMISRLSLLRPGEVRALHESAVRYYASRATSDSLVAHAEEIYHRLALGDDLDAVDDRWHNNLRPYFDRDTIDELPNVSRAYVAARFRLDLPDIDWGRARQTDWEDYVAWRAEELLGLKRRKEIFHLFRQRPHAEWSFEGLIRLFPLEAEAHAQAGNLSRAISLLAEGFQAGKQHARADVAAEFACRAERLDIVYPSSSNEIWRDVIQMLTEARQLLIKDSNTNPWVILTVIVANTRILRRHGRRENGRKIPAETSESLFPDTLNVLTQIQERLASRSGSLSTNDASLLREAASEINEWNPEAVHKIMQILQKLANHGTLRLTMTLSGAISLGAYEAGIVSQIAFALDAWNAQKVDSPPVAIIDVISGASAGSLTGAMLFRHLTSGGDPKQFVRDNFDCWCGDRTTFDYLFTKDLKPHSLLSTAMIDSLGADFLPSAAPVVNPVNIRQEECLFTCTLTALDSLPFTFNAATDVPEGSGWEQIKIDGVTHHDWITFAIGRDTPDVIEELPDSKPRGQGRTATWDRVRSCALASASVPAAWEPFRITRFANDYKPPLPIAADKPQVHYVDGGVLNNMPMNRSSEVLSSLKDSGEDTNRIYILIIPDPTPPTFSLKNSDIPDGRDSDMPVTHVLSGVYNAMGEQSFYRDLYKSQSLNRRIQARDAFLPNVMHAAARAFPPAEIPAEIDRLRQTLAGLISGAAQSGGAHTAAAQPDVVAAAGTSPVDAVLAGYVDTQQNVSPVRDVYTAIEDPQVKTLFLLYMAVADRIANLNDKCLIRIGLITPSQSTILAGYLLGHFGAMVAKPLMKHDFICGLQDAHKWMSDLAARHPEWAVTTPSVIDSDVAKEPALDFTAVDPTVSPWESISDAQKETVVHQFINRAGHFGLETAGIGGAHAGLFSGLEEDALMALIKFVSRNVKFPDTPKTPTKAPADSPA